ncbi:MAG: hypothetical protein EOO42_24175 [Flavobacteriales bacterium]|nr:MAG: hypothetical protein EOO42_24175 [Flavobacteriales bacterium]
MKNLKNAIKMLPLMLLFLTVSCKKDKVKPEVVSDPVTKNDLVDYYIVAQHKTGGHRIMVAYFELNGDVLTVKATRQGAYNVLGVAVSHGVTVENGQFSIDWNGDGRTSMYRFTVEKDGNGNLKLKAYDFQFNGEGNLLAYAVLAKKTEALPFDGDDFKMAAHNLPFESVKSGIPLSFTTFIGSKILFWPTRNLENQLDPYDNIISIGFTTKANLLGVTVPYWKGINTPIMLIEIEDLLFIAAKQ